MLYILPTHLARLKTILDSWKATKGQYDYCVVRLEGRAIVVRGRGATPPIASFRSLARENIRGSRSRHSLATSRVLHAFTNFYTYLSGKNVPTTTVKTLPLKNRYTMPNRVFPIKE